MTWTKYFYLISLLIFSLLRVAPEATESPNITTERTTEGTAERTTETVHEERGSKDGEQSNKSLIIGLTLGVSFLIVVLIGNHTLTVLLCGTNSLWLCI